jgi:hypothetical protein
MAATCASNQEVALETSTSDARVLIPAGDVELIPNDALQIASTDIPSSSHQLASHDLGASFILLQSSGNLAFPDLAILRAKYCLYTHLFSIPGFG